MAGRRGDRGRDARALAVDLAVGPAVLPRIHLRDPPAGAPYLLEGRASGELAGSGRWRLFEAQGRTASTWDWDVETTARWMNLLGPLARPAFMWNHDRVMRQGAEGLARELGVELIAAG